MGYHRAGFEVVGVDLEPQPHFPFEFHQGDALTYPLEGFDAIHASPPCQAYTPLNALTGYKHTLDLVAPVRERLLASGVPFVIENVPGAPLVNYTLLCGTMFDLRVIRHRWFEVHPYPLLSPRSCCHSVPVAWRQVKAGFNQGLFVSVTGNRGSYVSSRAMDIDWMTGDELSQAIPPAYTEYIGRQLIAALENAA